ncbi:methyltransferase [Caloranaerobacter azorensis H53214]|uniref:16S rRNA (Guanine(966)-N(2))-methyltransferase RsmD n=2 Tax=Caloranaerobacter azorensis TaxID=116090 RepID=A0A1M5RQD8_9FIRM|nr:16S rRNA (guanine(966)-N(2))-methyltransferase RsmD [Caloranaerobacter azorensis]KGG81129.1 methyltransferase [Caloranaerobacter azorensis H53214]SHH28517.1 16S rRNA (guanine(966)-N(2))-methyltransferase RsmD [Caloranaerobacter azorensis DSM 13643]
MRVITGTAKGHRLKVPKGLDVRPTTDRIKESLFNILGNNLEGSVVLDLFAGSGSIGIEFLSRGAKECYFIDNSIISIKAIKENLIKTKLIDKSYVYKNTAEKAIKKLGIRGIRFDYIFMDPPYEKGLVIPTLESIAYQDLLKEEGIIIIEHESKLDLLNEIVSFVKVRENDYGNTKITFYEFRR